MIPPLQREALAILAELCDLSSEDIRLGQLLSLIGLLGESESGRNLWNIEDDEFLSALNVHKSQLLARLSESEQQAFHSGGSSPLFPQGSAAANITPSSEVGH
jgi:hypothetical protein